MQQPREKSQIQKNSCCLLTQWSLVESRVHYKISLLVTILPILIFTCSLLHSCLPSTFLSAKVDCFFTTLNTPSDAFLISQQSFWLLWCPLICHRSHSMTHPKERLPSCFKPTSSSQPQGYPTATGSKHHTHKGDRIAAPFLQGDHKCFSQVSETRAGSCLRSSTGRWHPLAVKDTIPIVGAGLTFLCLKSPNPRVLPQEIWEYLLPSLHCKNWDQSHQPLHPWKIPYRIQLALDQMQVKDTSLLLCLENRWALATFSYQ